MKLGSSMRRRRGSSGSPGGGGRRGGNDRGWWPGLGGLVPSGGRGRLLLLAVVALLTGSGGGYLYATQVVFPADEVQVANFRTVPDLRGMALDEARTALDDMELAYGEVDSIQHPEATESRIVGQTPLPGQLGVPGGTVDVTISLGPERRPVPDVTRLIASRALTVLETTGFAVQVDSTESDAPAGRVVETDPAAGEEVVLPSEIRVTVSLGPPLVELPDLVGMQEVRARQILDSLGLEVGEVGAQFRFGFNQGEVLGQLPEAGTEVPQGSVVRLEVGRRGFMRNPQDGT